MHQRNILLELIILSLFIVLQSCGGVSDSPNTTGPANANTNGRAQTDDEKTVEINQIDNEKNGLNYMNSFLGTWDFDDVTWDGNTECDNTLSFTIEMQDSNVKVSKRSYRCGLPGRKYDSVTTLKTDLLIYTPPNSLKLGPFSGLVEENKLTISARKSGCSIHFLLERKPEDSNILLTERSNCLKKAIYTSRGPLKP